MTTLTEGKHRGEFLVSEANGHRSRATATVALGQNLVAGQLVALSGSSLIAMSGALNTAGDLIATCVGIVYDNYDASTDGDAGAAIAGGVYIARDAEVKLAELTFPDETTDGGEQAQCVAQLATLGIICRS